MGACVVMKPRREPHFQAHPPLAGWIRSRSRNIFQQLMTLSHTARIADSVAPLISGACPLEAAP